MRRKNAECSRCQHPTVTSLLRLVSTLFSIQSTSVVAFSYQHHAASRKGMSSSPRLMQKSMELHMGLYDEDIDWDADLFRNLPNKRQNSNPSPSNNKSSTKNTASSADSTDVGQWDMGQSNKSTMQTMRDKMKRQMGETSDGKPEGKPDVGWVPNYGKIVDEDEPWFTG
eukprot:scaffold1256_cov150-Skeletonema_menzelii.AAC.17